MKARYPLSELTVGVLGMAFKPNNDDPRDSLSYKLRKVLLLECRTVLCSDPYVKDDSLVPQSEVLEKADVILIGTPHDCYKSLKFRQPVVDVTRDAEERDGGSGGRRAAGSRGAALIGFQLIQCQTASGARSACGFACRVHVPFFSIGKFS